MKTTVDIPENLLREVKVATSARTNKDAIIAALTEYLRVRRSAELVTMLGTFENLMTSDDLDHARSDM